VGGWVLGDWVPGVAVAVSSVAPEAW